VAEVQTQENREYSWVWWVVVVGILSIIILLSAVAQGRRAAASGEFVPTTVTGAAAPGAPRVLVAPATSAAAESDAPTTGSEAAPNGGVVTDLGTLTSATTAATAIGQRVMLTDVPVFRATSDKGFWVGSGMEVGQGVFAVRGNQNASYTAPNGEVTAGTHVNIYGTVQPMPANLTEQSTVWNLSSTDRKALSAQPIYIAADSVRFSSR
jgi:hypothetical protein